jgi:hypothetical protein
MADESPTIEQPTTPPPAEIDTKALLDELGKIGVKKPEELVNIHNASQQVGKAWNEVGTLRQQNEQLLQAVRELQTKVSQPASREPDYGSNTEGVDLGKMIDTKLDAGIKRNIREMQQQQFDAQRHVQREYAKITNDPDFQLVEEVWKRHASTFDTQDRLQSGQSTLSEEYNNVVKTYYREIAKRSRSAIEGLSKNSQKQPHMETGETQSRPIPSGDQEHNKKVRQITEDRSKGNLDSNKALENLVKEFFPADMFKI